MTTKIGVDIEADASGLDPGITQATKRIEEFSGAAKKTTSELGSSSQKMAETIEKSSKQTVAAMRMVPAQMTDIVTQLAGGQSPLLVLTQQGGQLKDTLGGIGPAASAVGTYLTSLINPATIAAGSIGLLALAYSKGAEEQENFTRTLILTGGAAAVSAGQLMDASRQVASTTGATQSSVAGLMNVILASGQVSADMLAKVAKAAIDLERAGGPAAAATVKEFIALGEKPVEAVKKLHESNHAFTGAIFEQVKALDDQGRATDAARVAQTAYHDEIEKRTPSMVKNIGYIQAAWEGVIGAGKRFIDGTLDIGRTSTLEENLAKTKERLQNLQAAPKSATPGGKAAIEAVQKVVESIEQQIAAERKLVAAKAETVKAEDAKIKQISTYSTYMADQSNAPKAVKLAADIEKENKAFAAAVQGLQQTDQAYGIALKAHNDRVAQLRSNAARGEKDPALEALLNRSDEAQRIRKQLEDELKDIDKLNERRARADQIVTNYNSKSDQMVERIARQNELIGVSEREVLVREALYKVEDDALQVSQRITEQVKDETERKRALALVEEGLAAKKTLVADATRLAYEESRTFEIGWSGALNKYKDDASNAADTARTAFTGMTDAMQGAIKSFAKNGKIDIDAFGDAVINTLIDIQMQSLKTSVLAPMMSAGGLGGFLSGLFGGSSGNIGAGSSVTNTASTYSIPVESAAVTMFPLQHSGGIVGTSEGSGSRSVNPALFAGAPRFHSGGIASDEVPTILQRGEGVFTAGQMKALGSSAPQVNLTIINQGAPDGYQATARTQKNDAGGLDIELLFAKAMQSDMRRNGPITQGLSSMFGMQRAV